MLSCVVLAAEDDQNVKDDNSAHRNISGEGDCSPKHVPIPEVHILSDTVDPCDDALSAKDIDLETNVDFEQEAETALRSSDATEFQDNCIVEKNVEDFVEEDVGEHDNDAHRLERIPSNDLTLTDAENRFCDSSEETSATFWAWPLLLLFYACLVAQSIGAWTFVLFSVVPRRMILLKLESDGIIFMFTLVFIIPCCSTTFRSFFISFHLLTR